MSNEATIQMIPSHAPVGSWIKTDPHERAVPGQRYRTTIYIRAPFRRELVDLIAGAIRFGVGLRNKIPFQNLHDAVRIERVSYSGPKTDNRTGRYEPWAIHVEWIEGRAEIELVLGLILAIIIAAAGAVAISGKETEKLIASGGSALSKTVFNPGLILGAFVLGFLFLTKGGK